MKGVNMIIVDSGTEVLGFRKLSVIVNSERWDIYTHTDDYMVQVKDGIVVDVGRLDAGEVRVVMKREVDPLFREAHWSAIAKVLKERQQSYSIHSEWQLCNIIRGLAELFEDDNEDFSYCEWSKEL